MLKEILLLNVKLMIAASQQGHYRQSLGDYTVVNGKNTYLNQVS